MKSHVIDQRIVKNTFKVLMMSFAWALLDKKGFTEDETKRTLKDVEYIWDSMSQGRINVFDMEKMLDEEYDMQFK